MRAQGFEGFVAREFSGSCFFWGRGGGGGCLSHILCFCCLFIGKGGIDPCSGPFYVPSRTVVARFPSILLSLAIPSLNPKQSNSMIALPKNP